MVRQSDNLVSFPAGPSARRVCFGPLLRERRAAAGLSQQEVADRLRVTRNTVVNWETDRTRPDYAMVPALCELLGIRLHELFGFAGEGAPDPLESRVLASLRLLDPAGRRVVDKVASALAEEALLRRGEELKASFRLFPVRPGFVSAGPGEEVPAAAPGFVLLRRSAVNERAGGVVRVRGRSMEPLYLDGEEVYFRPASSARPGEDVIVDTDEGAVIKRVAPGRKLCSLNPAFPYPARGEDSLVLIRGVVLGKVRPGDRPAPEERAGLEELFAEEISAFTRDHGL